MVWSPTQPFCNHRIYLALAAVCADWEIEQHSPDDMRPPQFFIQLPESCRSDMDLLCELVLSGSTHTNLSQLINLAHLYQGQVAFTE